MLDVDYISLSAPSSHKTSLNGGNTIPTPRHIAPHSRPTATAHYIGQRDRRGHFSVYRYSTLDLYRPTFYMTCRLEFDNKHYNRVSLLLQGCIFNIELAHSFSYHIKSDYWRGLND